LDTSKAKGKLVSLLKIMDFYFKIGQKVGCFVLLHSWVKKVTL